MSESLAALAIAAFLVPFSGTGWHATLDGTTRGAPDPSVVKIAGSSSETIGIKIQLLRRAPSGNVITIRGSRTDETTKSVAFKMVFEAVPTGKKYQFWMQDQGMKAEGLPPVPVPNDDIRYEVDQAGRWRSYGRDASGSPEPPAFSLVNYAKGEWIQIQLRSTDGAISKTFRFAPYR